MDEEFFLFSLYPSLTQSHSLWICRFMRTDCESGFSIKEILSLPSVPSLIFLPVVSSCTKERFIFYPNFFFFLFPALVAAVWSNSVCLFSFTPSSFLLIRLLILSLLIYTHREREKEDEKREQADEERNHHFSVSVARQRLFDALSFSFLPIIFVHVSLRIPIPLPHADTHTDIYTEEQELRPSLTITTGSQDVSIVRDGKKRERKKKDQSEREERHTHHDPDGKDERLSLIFLVWAVIRRNLVGSPSCLSTN